MRHLIVPLDGSGFAESALPVALTLARRHGAQVELVTVREGPPVQGGMGAMSFDSRADDARREELGRYLEKQVEQLRTDFPGAQVVTTIIDGTPAESIAEHALETAADLVVITSHGRGGSTRLLLGSVTEQLVRSLSVPVLVVRASGGEPYRQVAEFRRILVAVDGTPLGEQALTRALQLFRGPETEFILLHVVQPLHPALQKLASDEQRVQDLEEQRARWRVYLHDLLDRMGSDANIRPDITVQLEPAEGILAYANEHDVECIALSTKARGALGRAALGSVADQVVRTASVPVLLCTPHGEEQTATRV